MNILHKVHLLLSAVRGVRQLWPVLWRAERYCQWSGEMGSENVYINKSIFIEKYFQNSAKINKTDHKVVGCLNKIKIFDEQKNTTQMRSKQEKNGTIYPIFNQPSKIVVQAMWRGCSPIPRLGGSRSIGPHRQDSQGTYASDQVKGIRLNE